MGKAVVTRLEKEKLYLADFELISGQYGQPFKMAFYAKDAADLERLIHAYLMDYYGTGNTSEIDGNTYFYWHGEVAVKKYGWERVTSFKQIVNKLL